MYERDLTPPPFDVTSKGPGTRDRVRALELELRERNEREESVYRDVRAIKWAMRLAVPVIVAMFAILPWLVKQVVRDSLIDLGVVKTVGTWSAGKE